MPTRRSPVVAHLFASHDTPTSLSLGSFPRILPRCQHLYQLVTHRSDLTRITRQVYESQRFSLELSPLVSN